MQQAQVNLGYTTPVAPWDSVVGNRTARVGLLCAAGGAAVVRRADRARLFRLGEKKYLRNPVEEQVEVASLIGNVALGENGEAALHVHTVLGRRSGDALAGHPLEAELRPTLEIVLTESPVYPRKRHDPESGLALIEPGA
jgi:uncharacterized protein